MPRKKRRYHGHGGASSPGDVGERDRDRESRRIRPKDDRDDDVGVARHRFKDALTEAMECNADSSDASSDAKDRPKQRRGGPLDDRTKAEPSSDDEARTRRRPTPKKPVGRQSRQANSYVMKLFDRSVDLARFTEDTPLYTICRAWMANDPRGDSSEAKAKPAAEAVEEGVALPPPEGHPVSRVPPLLPEQCCRSKYNINLNYDEEPPIPTSTLMKLYLIRWKAIRNKWLQQSVIYESRYARTQEILNEMDTNT